MANLTVGSTYRFKPNSDGIPEKDGTDWTTATMKIRFRGPDGFDTGYVACTAAGGGAWYYDNASTLFTVAKAGQWQRSWQGVEGAVVLNGEDIPFLVVPT